MGKEEKKKITGAGEKLIWTRRGEYMEKRHTKEEEKDKK